MSESVFQTHRPRLFALAYRMLGSVADAEDVLQDAYLRWHESQADVESPAAFLRTTVTRLCIDRLRSAKVRREQYVGPWLPEPLETTTVPSAEQQAELAETVTVGFLLLLEKLTPVQRAVFLLHDVFDYSYEEIAPVVQRSVANCRQLARRARMQLAQERPPANRHMETDLPLVEKFLSACRSGDTSQLIGLLADDAVLVSDGGGKATAARRPIVGAEAIAKFLVGVTKRSPSGTSFKLAFLNGQPAVIIRDQHAVQTAYTFEIVDGRVRRLFVMRNPEKLTKLA